MPFDIGLSGINAAHADLKVTSNNIANAATVGYKASRAEFANVYSLSKFGAASTAIGRGVRVSDVSQQFTQGNISFTENNLDIAINGDGFFNLVDNAGSKVYSRNGQFKVDKNGYVVNNDGYRLQGYQVTSANNDAINTGDIDSLQLTTTQIAPQATSTSDLIANIDAASTVIPAATNIDPQDPTSYHHTTSYTTFDSLGNEMLTSIYFQKNVDAVAGGVNSSWTVGVRTVDAAGTPMPANAGTTHETVDYTVEFDTAGNLVVISGNGAAYDATAGTGTPTLPLVYDGATTAPVAGPPTGANNQTIALDISGVTQYGANFSVTDIQQNGFTTGNLSGIEVDQSGIVVARFTNGESKNLGQIILSGFANPQGLGQLGDNLWAESFASGQPVVNVPGDGSLGLVQSGALEEANVNLTEELIGLITAQRNFQANSKIITTADTISQTIIQM